MVSGREALRAFKGVPLDDSKWTFFAYTVLNLVFYRLLLALFMYQSPKTLW